MHVSPTVDVEQILYIKKKRSTWSYSNNLEFGMNFQPPSPF